VRLAVVEAVLAAFTFGLSPPLAKLLLGELSPLLLAGLLYLGSAILLTALRGFRAPAAPRRFDARGRSILAGAVVAGGILAPPLLLWGLARSPASTAALLLNLEVVLTALLASTVFGEHLGIRVASATVLVAAGGVALSWPAGAAEISIASLAVAGACLLWAVDNNLTRLIAHLDAVTIARVRGLAAGAVNVLLALASGATVPGWRPVVLSLCLGMVSYGASLVLFVRAMRRLGAARTAGYFALGPFFGAAAAVSLLREPVTPGMLIAAGCMAGGVWLLARERHSHPHRHEPGTPLHGPEADALARPGAGGRGPDASPAAGSSPAPIEHDHPHAPDAHHRHPHP
jgi:drug/metabolite transporter (DMT)-like permease